MLVRAVSVAAWGLALWALSRTAEARMSTAPASTPSHLRGRVLLPDDGSPLGLRVYAAIGAHVDSADVDVTGGFTVALTAPVCDSLDIRIDVASDQPRRYHAAHLRVPVPSRADTSTEAIRIVLVPTAYTVEGGTHAGAIIPITVDAAVAGAGERSRYWRVSRSRHGYGVPIGWPSERFPLPVAVYGWSRPLRPADSTAFWAIARQLERDAGRTLFRPISLDSAQSEGWSISVALNPAEDSPGVTFISYDGPGDLFDATVALQTPALLRDEHVVTHELMHALGFGHSVGWQSVLSTSYHSVARVTAADVAHAQLFYRIRRVHVEQGATHGILASTAEARRRRGAVAVSECASRRAP